MVCRPTGDRRVDPVPFKACIASPIPKFGAVPEQRHGVDSDAANSADPHTPGRTHDHRPGSRTAPPSGTVDTRLPLYRLHLMRFGHLSSLALVSPW